jgi:hypothetical protein
VRVVRINLSTSNDLAALSSVRKVVRRVSVSVSTHISRALKALKGRSIKVRAAWNKLMHVSAQSIVVLKQAFSFTAVGSEHVSEVR